MPATAGRVRMPANNRVHSSAALQTHGIWQSAIGYDPYAPNKDDTKNASQVKSSNAEAEPENPYANFQGLLALARITGSNADEARGACKRCGRVGHLSFQCRNFLSVKEDIKEKDADAIEAAVLSGLEKIKGKNGKAGDARNEDSEEEEDESDTSDSEVDSEIERIIAERYGKKGVSKGRSSRKDSDKDVSDSDSGERKKRGRSKKRRVKKRETSDSEDEDAGKSKGRKRERRRKRDDSSEEEEERHHRHKRKSRKEKRRRRSHRYSDSDSDASDDSGRRRRRKSRKHAPPSDSDVSGSDDSRVGRGTKRSKKRSKKRHHEEE